MDLYHIRKYKDEIDNYKVGQILEFNKDKPNQLRQEALDFDGYYLDKIKENINYWEPLEHIFNIDLNEVDRNRLRRMKDSLEVFVHNEKIFKRESILEEIRREYYSGLPSRYNCMWVTDEECIDSWMKLLEERDLNMSVFKIELDGNLFATTDELLPDPVIKTKDIYEQAHRYWNPTESDLNNSIKREYLFEGTAKIIRKVK